MTGDIKNEKLGGSDFPESPDTSYEMTGEDLNATFNEVADRVFNSLLHSIIANYRTLEANNIFENGVYSFADEYVDSNGTNNTVSTGSSTAKYNATDDVYRIIGLTGTTEADSYTTGSDSNQSSYSTVGTIDSSSGYFSSCKFYALSTSAGRYCTVVVKKGTVTIATAYVQCPAQAVYAASFVREDYSELLESGDAFTVTYTMSTGSAVTVTNKSYSGTLFSYTNERVMNTTAPSLTFSEYVEGTSGTVLHNANTIELDGTEKGLIIYGKNSFAPQNGTVTDETVISSPTASGDTTTKSCGIKCTATTDFIIMGATSSTKKDSIFRNGSGSTILPGEIIYSGETFYVSLNSVDDFNPQSQAASFPVAYTNFNVVGSGWSTGNNQYNFSDTVELYEILTVKTRAIDVDATDTTITYDVSDGTTTISDKTAESYIDISSLSAGTLEITSKLASTDASEIPVGPETYGISVGVFK